MPKFCYLNLRLLVERCQKPSPPTGNIQSPASTGEKSKLPHEAQASSSKPNANQAGESANRLPNNAENNHFLRITPPYADTKVYTIFCVDDSPTVFNAIKSFLDEQIFSVIGVTDPLKALMEILRTKPDIILLDVTMPNIDGYELCSLLRKHSYFKNTPVIMVTGKTGLIDRAKAKIVRASGYLTKPFNQGDLLKIIFQHII